MVEDDAGFVADADGAFDDAVGGESAGVVEGDVPGAGGEGEVVAEVVGAVGDDAISDRPNPDITAVGNCAAE